MCPSPGHDGKPLERFSLSGFPDHLIHHTDLLQLSCFTASATHGMVRDGRNEDLRTLQRPASPFTRRSEVVDEKRLNEIQYPLVVQSVHKAFHDPSIVVPDKKKIQPPAHVVIPPPGNAFLSTFTIREEFMLTCVYLLGRGKLLAVLRELLGLVGITFVTSQNRSRTFGRYLVTPSRRTIHTHQRLTHKYNGKRCIEKTSHKTF